MSERVCAVVVTYNRKAMLKKCLDALISQTRKPDHILVIDNASNDGTFEMVKEHFSEVEIVRLSENQGGAGGFYEGIKEAYEKAYDWIWIMDDDAIPETNALEKLLSYAGVADVLVPVKVDSQKKRYGCGMWRLRYVNINLDNEEKENSNLIPIELFSFVGPLFKREVIERIGFPRKDFFISADDWEWALRIKYGGLRVYAVPSAIIFHEYGKPRHVKRWGRSSIRDSQPPWKYYYGTRNMYLMLNSIPRFERILARIILVLLFVRWSLGDILYEPDWRKRIRYRILGLWHGILGKTGKLVEPRGDKVF